MVRPVFDTSALSRLAEPPNYDYVETLVELARSEGVALSIISVYEIERGLMLEETRQRGSAKRRAVVWELISSAEILPFDIACAHAAAQLWTNSKSHKPSLTLGEADLLIAATAIVEMRLFVTLDQRLIDALEKLGHRDLVHGAMRG